MARRVRWNGNGIIQSLAGIALNSAVVIGAAEQEMEGGHTIVRVRGELGVRVSSVLSGVMRLAAGLIVLNEGVAGTANVPNPALAADQGADWLWHSWIILRSPEGDPNAGFGGRSLIIDNKAMRKIRDHTNLVWVVQSLDATNTQWALGVRVLFALP